MELKYRRNPFKDDPVYEVLGALASQHDPASREARALKMSGLAILFIFAPPDWFYSEEGRILASIKEILIHMERGHSYVAALAPWVEDVKKRATEEQLQFLQKIGLDGVQEEEEGSGCWIGDDDAEAPEGEAPEVKEAEPAQEEEALAPAEGLSLLEALARRADPRTADHTCLELAVQTLRFLMDTHQVDAFSTFLDELKKPPPPRREMDRAALG